MYRCAAFLLITAAALYGGIVDSNAATSGRLAAEASRPIPPRSSIAVQAAGADDRTETLVQAITRSLERQGYLVSGDGGMILEFRVEDAGIAAAGRKPRLQSERVGEPDNVSRTEDSDQIKIELERKNRATPQGDLHIEFYLYERGRPPIWSATIEAARSLQDEDRQLVRMVQIAMDAFGKTEDRRFDALD